MDGFISNIAFSHKHINDINSVVLDNQDQVDL